MMKSILLTIGWCLILSQGLLAQNPNINESGISKTLSEPSEQVLTQPHLKSTILSQDFETGLLPSGWSNTFGAATFGWLFGTDLSSPFWNIPAHTTYAVANDDSCNCNMSDVNLTTAAVDLSSGGYTLRFDYLNYASGAGETSVQISINGGVSYTTIEVLPTVSVWADDYEIDLSAYTSSNTFIRFHYSDGGSWAWGLAIDNVSIFNAGTHDLQAYSIQPLMQVGGSDYYPQVTVKNTSTSTETDFNVSVIIRQGATVFYNDTMVLTGQSLTPGTSMDVAFTTPFSMPAAGNYEVEAIVRLIGDNEPNNDTLIENLEIISLPTYPHQAYSINVIEGVFNAVNLSNGDLSNQGTFETDDFPMSMKFIDSLLFLVRSSGSIEMVYSDGNTRPMGTISGILGTPIGLAHDGVSDITYLMVSNAGNSVLYSLNMQNLNASPIGTTCLGLMSAIEMDAAGHLYGIKNESDSTYLIDVTDGSCSAIGLIGLDVNYIQDIAWDATSNTLYAMLYNDNGTGGVFGTIDVATGLFNPIATLTDQFSTLAINSNIVGINEFANAPMQIYPNPADGHINIAIQGQAEVIITDLTGRIILSEEINGTKRFSTEGMNSGIYIVSCHQNGVVSTSKLIVE